MSRRGLVLGAGGVLGFTWTVGALHALEQSIGLDVRDMDVIVGTSAGSIMAAVLSCGVGVDVVLRHQRGQARPGDVRIDWDYDSDSGGALPPLPMLGVGSPRLLARVARHPTRFTAITAASALLPRGRGRLAPVSGWSSGSGMVPGPIARPGSSPWTTRPAGGPCSVSRAVRRPGCPRRWPRRARSPAGTRRRRSAAGPT
ncbi:MAG: patatin-like phospholipase family protein [Geodermatophilaceae bacterium]|nr:patatin-like phospholipase family protein [Geodermatophilaceae bacterium]